MITILLGETHALKSQAELFQRDAVLHPGPCGRNRVAVWVLQSKLSCFHMHSPVQIMYFGKFRNLLPWYLPAANLAPCCWRVVLAARALPVGEISEPMLQRALCHHVRALHSHWHLTQASRMQWNLQAPSAQIRMVAKATLVSPLVMVLLGKGAAKWKSALGNRAAKRGQV